MSLAPGFRLGAHEILAGIGAGGMGEVCRARDTKLDRDVAIKILTFCTVSSCFQAPGRPEVTPAFSLAGPSRQS